MKYEQCAMCKGSGLHYTGEDLENCFYCKGNGTAPARDEKGRFVK